jgi:DNA modification methylase
MLDHKNTLKIEYIKVGELKENEYNPKSFSEEDLAGIRESIKSFGFADPLVVNGSEERHNVLVGGHGRLKVAKELGFETVPVVYVNLSLDKERELNVRLHRNQGRFDFELLSKFDESLLSSIGFSSEELDNIFFEDPTPEQFDLKHELEKLNIKEVKVKKGDRYEIDGSVLMCGDSTIEADMLKLMDGVKADMVMTDPPYLLDYLRGKTKQKDGVAVGFGAKKNRRYLETESLPDDFTDLWMANVAKVQKDNFSIMIFENPKNLRTIWNALEKFWKYRNTITWHVPNRMQGFSAKYKFFNKTDIALVGTDGDVDLNLEQEDELFQNEYENALYATSGSPTWESYGKGKKYCPTDFIEHIAADKKSSGQDIIFGTKPLELLIPYIKVLTNRDDLVLEPFGGSGSTLIASLKLGRKCRIMEKSPVYTEVIIKRWEKHTGKKVTKLN